MTPQLKEAVDEAFARANDIIQKRAEVTGKNAIFGAWFMTQIRLLPPPSLWFGPPMEGADTKDDVLPDFVQAMIAPSAEAWLPVFTLQLREALGERRWAELIDHMAWVLCADQIPGSGRVWPEYFQYWPWTSWLRRPWLTRLFDNPSKCLARHLHDHPFELVCVTLYFFKENHHE